MNNLLGLLGLLFIGLKLATVGVVAAWPWWLVLLPWYGGILVWLAIVILGLLGIGFSSAVVGTARKFKL